MTPAARVKAIFDEAIGSDLSSWEKFEFLPNIRGFIILRNVAFIVTETSCIKFIFGQTPHFGQ